MIQALSLELSGVTHTGGTLEMERVSVGGQQRSLAVHEPTPGYIGTVLVPPYGGGYRCTDPKLKVLFHDIPFHGVW